MSSSFMPPEVQAVGNTVKEGIGILGTISQGLSMAWNALWYGAFVVLGGRLLFNTDIGKSITSFFTDFLKDSEWGKAILAFLDQYLTPILTKMGSDSPFKGFAASYVDQMTPEQFAAQMKKDFNLDADVSSKLFNSRGKLFAAGLDKAAIATPDGLKKLLAIIPDDAALALFNQSQKSGATATSAEEEFNKKLDAAIKIISKETEYAQSLVDSHPKLMDAIVKSRKTTSNAPASAASAQAPAATPAPAPATVVVANNEVFNQLIKVPHNQKALIALNAAIDSAPEPQKQAVMATIASVISGKFDLANKDELVKFFADEKQRKAVTDFIINLDVSTITDKKTQTLLTEVKKAAPVLGTILADQKSVDYLDANKDKPESTAIIAARKSPEFIAATALKLVGVPAPIANNFHTIDALTTAIKASQTPAPAAAKPETPAPPAPAPAAKDETQAPIPEFSFPILYKNLPVDKGNAPDGFAAIINASLSDNLSKHYTVLEVTGVDPYTARMIVAAQGNAGPQKSTRASVEV